MIKQLFFPIYILHHSQFQNNDLEKVRFIVKLDSVYKFNLGELYFFLSSNDV